MALLVFYVALALCVSFLCSLLESSILTITPTQVRSAQERGATWAKSMHRLKDDIERPLAAILTLNTIAHTMGAAGAGAQYAALYGDGGEAIFAAALTLAILIVTEIIPKTLGARYATALAPFTSRLLPLLIRALAPLVWASRQITKVVTFGKSSHVPQHREELLALASLGQAAGQIDSGEVRFVKNMFQLHAIKTSDVMTPRTVTFSLPLGMPFGEFAREVRESPHTRIPVYTETVDRIAGFVIKGEVLAMMTREEEGEKSLDGLIRPLPSVLDELTVDRLFHRLIAERHHIMAVVDEYGTFLGLVTLEDVLETIFGFEIVDELDKVPDLQAYARELSRKRTAAIGGGSSPQ